MYEFSSQNLLTYLLFLTSSLDFHIKKNVDNTQEEQKCSEGKKNAGKRRKMRMNVGKNGHKFSAGNVF
jgi:hypothetical protein